MDLLEGLKYGAIGLCGILFIISTRLLLKEQNRKDDARQPILNMIKIFLGAAVLLSFFFGLTEFLKPTNTNNDMELAINKIWKSYYANNITDTTLIQKTNRIKNTPLLENRTIDTLKVCEQLKQELDECRQDLNKIDHKFYTNIVLLKLDIDEKGESINIDWDEKNKKDTYTILEEILIELDQLQPDNNSNLTIKNTWKKYKGTWSQQNTKYILYSDLPQLVRKYLNKFHSND